jgi:hypothetical protein
MSLGEVSQISEGIYPYLQPDGSWWLNNTGFLVSTTGVISVDASSSMVAYNGGRPLTCHA